MNKTTFHIRGMHCRSCELRTEAELMKVAGVTRARVNSRTGLAEVLYENHLPSPEVLAGAVRKAGYEIGAGKRGWVVCDLGVWTEVLFALGTVLVLFLVAKSVGLFDVSLGSSEKLSSVPFVLLVGLVAGFSTCMAMIGGMVLAVSARFSEEHPEASVRKKFLPHLSFNLGRIVGFAFFGAILGWVGSVFQLASSVVGGLTLLVALVMLLVGVQLLEVFPRLSTWKLTLPKGIARVLGIQSYTEKEYHHGRVALLGGLTFFLPCGFTQLTQLFVVTQGSPFIGALTMGTFALGTAPGLIGIGGVAATARGWFRRFFFRVAGVIVIALGIFNLHNGMVLVGLGAHQSGSEKTSPLGSDTQAAQVVRVTQKADGYFPNQITVKRGQPVQLIVDSEESYSCAASLVIPKAGIKKVLKPGENIFEFTPDQIGDIPFSCSMGMYRGVITVVE